MTMTRVSSLAFVGFCAAGLIWQLIAVTDQYLKFKVSTVIDVFTPDVIKPTAMTLCVESFRVLDYDRVNQELKTRMSITDSGAVLNLEVVQNMSLRQWFSFTPSNESILTYGSFKARNDSVHISWGPLFRQNLIYEYFKVTKFLYRIYVCYKITVKNRETLSYRENAVSNYNEFTTTVFIFNKSLENSTSNIFIVSSVDHLPYKELISTPVKKTQRLRLQRQFMFRFESLRQQPQDY